MNKIPLLFVLAAALVGCDKTPPSQSSAPQAPPITELRLGYFPNVTHAQAVLEVASGELQTALGQIQLKPTTFNAGPALIEALNGGELDIAYVGPGPVLSTHVTSHGQSVRVIAGAAANGVVIVAGKDSGINSLKDLAGKKVATPELGNTQDTAARHYVTSVLGQPDSDNVVGIPNAQQSALMAKGQIDAAWVPEPWGARLIAETGAKLIAEEKDLWPQKRFALTVVITTPKFLVEHPDVVAKVLAVHHQWTVRLTQNPQSYATQLNAALKTLTSKSLADDVLAGALARTQFTDDPYQDTFQTMAQWKFKSPPTMTGLFEPGIMTSVTAGAPATQP